MKWTDLTWMDYLPEVGDSLLSERNNIAGKIAEEMRKLDELRCKVETLQEEIAELWSKKEVAGAKRQAKLVSAGGRNE